MEDLKSAVKSLLACVETMSARLDAQERRMQSYEQQVNRVNLLLIRLSLDKPNTNETPPPGQQFYSNQRSFYNEFEESGQGNYQEERYRQSFGRSYQPRPPRLQGPYRSRPAPPAFHNSSSHLDEFDRHDPAQHCDDFRLSNNQPAQAMDEQLQSPNSRLRENPRTDSTGSSVRSNEPSSDENETVCKTFYDPDRARHHDEEYQPLQENPNEEDDYENGDFEGPREGSVEPFNEPSFEPSNERSNEGANEEASNEFPGFDDDDEMAFGGGGGGDDYDNYADDDVALPGLNSRKEKPFDYFVINIYEANVDEKVDGIMPVKAHLSVAKQSHNIDARSALKFAKPKISKAFADRMAQLIPPAKKVMFPGKGSVKIFERNLCRMPVFLDEELVDSRIRPMEFEIDPTLEFDLVCDVITLMQKR